MSTIPRVTLGEIASRYDGFLFDAYGVLITHDHALPGAAETIRALGERGVPYRVLTNDASRSPAATAARYRDLGVPVEEDRVITSGSTLPAWFREHGLRGAECVVLGTADSEAYVREAGGKVVPLTADTRASALVVCDERGYPLRESLDHAVSFLFRSLDAGREVHRILANPDLLYPAGHGRYGFTAGGVALFLEAALSLRYPERDLRFGRLGKPAAPMFASAVEQLGTRRVLMVGDTPGTDIRGARDFGLDAALVEDAVVRPGEGTEPDPAPDWILTSLSLIGGRS